MKHSYLSRILALLLIAFSVFTIKAQNDYSVSAIPFQVYTASIPVQGTADDTYSPAVSIGFDFNYFGDVYNQLYVSTNGYLNFTPNTVGYSPWSFSLPFPDPASVIKNSILGSYHDMYNQTGGQGAISSSIVGSAPYRRFVVLYNNEPHFQCTTISSTLQIVLYETLNIIDVQIVDKPVCATWNGGNAALGILNQTGEIAIMAPGRNTGPWTAYHEGWRFQRPANQNVYNYTICDDNTDGIAPFNLGLVRTALFAANPSAVIIYHSAADAQNQNNPILGASYSNITANAETLYTTINGIPSKEVSLKVLDCNQDYDLDTVANSAEDLNGNGNLADDDTDGDGIPNFMGNDDDGDMVLTTTEYVFGNRSAQNPNALLDTDNDGILNYLDNDDDGDGTLTINEDYNSNNDPTDDDINNNGIIDYLDNTVLAVKSSEFNKNGISIYPNPTSDVLNIENRTNQEISNIDIYAVNGVLVKKINGSAAKLKVPVAELQSGIYFLKVQISDQIFNYKFIKK